MKKIRLDELLIQKGYFTSREQAKRATMAGLVYVNNERLTNVGMRVPKNALIKVKSKEHPYVSRGGLKLKAAIDTFSIQLAGKTVLDIGASAGGFTDCALQHGAKYVYAIDVGYGVLDWKLRQDPRVCVMERTNFRYVKVEDLKGESPNFATIDVSFISLSNIIPNLQELLLNGEVVALIKPQFEAKREQVEKGGIVRDPDVHKRVLINFVHLVNKHRFEVLGLTTSPIKGREGNIEFLGYLMKNSTVKSQIESVENLIQTIVDEAHKEM